MSTTALHFASVALNTDPVPKTRELSVAQKYAILAEQGKNGQKIKSWVKKNYLFSYNMFERNSWDKRNLFENEWEEHFQDKATRSILGDPEKDYQGGFLGGNRKVFEIHGNSLDTVSKKSRHANEPVPIEDFMSDDSDSSDEYFYDEEWQLSNPLL